MGIMEQLDTIRAAEPGCIVAAFADLSTEMVLGASTRTPLPREDLDTLLGEAVALLPGGARRAVLLTEDDTRVFLRDARSPSEAWCFILAASVAPSKAVTGLAGRIAATGGKP